MPAVDLSRPAIRAAVALAVGALLVLYGCATRSTTQEERRDGYDGDITTVVLRFDDQGASQIGSTTAAISARVIGADRAGVQVERTLEHTDGDRPGERIGHDGDTLTIEASCPDRFAIGSPTCLAHYEIEVPFGVVVRATSHHGDLVADDTRAEVELDSRDGDLEVIVAGDAGYAVTAGSEDGQTAVDVPDDPAGTPIRATSHDGDVTVSTRAEAAHDD